MDVNRIVFSAFDDARFIVFLWRNGWQKNVISTMLKSFICLGVVSLLWVAVGFSLAFGSPIGVKLNGIWYGIVGNPFDYAFFNQVEVLPNKLKSSDSRE